MQILLEPVLLTVAVENGFNPITSLWRNSSQEKVYAVFQMYFWQDISWFLPNKLIIKVNYCCLKKKMFSELCTKMDFINMLFKAILKAPWNHLVEYSFNHLKFFFKSDISSQVLQSLSNVSEADSWLVSKFISHDQVLATVYCELNFFNYQSYVSSQCVAKSWQCGWSWLLNG